MSDATRMDLIDQPALSTRPRFVVREQFATPVGAFVTVALIVGSLFALLTPAFTGYDEGQHFLRSWQLSNAHLTAIHGTDAEGRPELGEMMPADLRSKSLALFYDAFRPGQASLAFRHMRDAAPSGPNKFEGFASAAVYPPAPYLPAVLAIRAARSLGLSVLATVLLARVAMLMAYIGLVAFALRRIPYHHWLLAVLALAPVCIFQAAMISADGITIALAFVVIALAIRSFATDVGNLRTRDYVEVTLATLALGLGKPPYITCIALLLPAIWKHRSARYGMRLGASMLPGVLVCIGWTAYAQSVYIPPIYASVEGQYAYHGVDASRQLRFLESHPWSLFAVVGRTIGRTWRKLLHDAVGQVAGWQIPTAFAVAGTVITFGAIALAALQPAHARRSARGSELQPIEAPVCSTSRRVIMAVTGVCTAMGVFLLAYTGWNQVAAPRIDAFQGRYLFLPLALLIFSIAPVRQKYDLGKPVAIRSLILRTAPALACAGAAAIAFVSMVVHYY